ncbi:hypothetical protein Hanom_Chr04g00291541 [Helianthus anomalus]
MPAPAPSGPLDLRTMRGMKIAVNFPDLGYQFVDDDGQIFVPDPIVHRGLLEDGEVKDAAGCCVPVMDGDVEPQVDQVHSHEAPQIPRRVYLILRLPQSTQRLLERQVADPDSMMASLTQ